VSGLCPAGHTSTSDDYCDVCGAPMPAGGGAPAPSPTGAAPPSAAPSPASAPSVSQAPPGAQRTCPHCQAGNLADALFCEACGYDFTTGALPRSTAPAPAPVAAPDPAAPIAPAVPVEWVAELWVDPDWYAQQLDPTGPCPSAAAPQVVPLTARSLLVGRVSASRGIHPQLDAGADSAVSRRQAQLSTDGTRWFVEDLDSSNGTYVGAATAPLPGTALVPGQRRELSPDDRIYVGAWTRIVVRRATEAERATA
jgi:FHA domain